MDKYLLMVIGIVAGLLVGALVGYIIRRRIAEKAIGSAEEEAKRIVETAKKDGEAAKKEIIIEAKDNVIRLKADADREIKDRRNEVSKLEHRVLAKEETLDRKLENYERKEEGLNRRIKENEQKSEQIEQLREEQIKLLEKISGYTADAAKAELVEKICEEAERDAAVRLNQIEAKLHDEADEKAKNIISLAIQRLASDQVSEATVSVVALPNDEMKGRIIGREGRNIHKIETLTGVDLIIDDTPEAITLSCFDPIRREVAKLTLEKLIADGRIHPARIEEMVEKSHREVETMIKQAGERAVFETGINGLPGDVVRLLGRLKFRTSYGQNVLAHSVEVAYLAGIMANELGIDPTLAKRAGLLHDIGKALTQEVEGSHIQLGVDIAKKYKESKEVVHAIEAHHGDVEPRTIVAVLVQAADTISAARPGARREDLESYIQRLQRLEEISNSFQGVEKSFAIQAGREVRIMVKPEEVNDEQMVVVARDIVKKIEEELRYPGQIKVNVIRESRAIDFAK